jgi:Domain of unknown function (DUF397)
MEAIDSAPWRKSSYSGTGGGSCVEAADMDGHILVRDTTDRGGVVLSLAISLREYRTVPAAAGRAETGRGRPGRADRGGTADDLEPTILGVTITERQILLAFFGFLGIDTLIERTGRLRRIERRLETLAEKASGQQAAGQVLRARSSFERMDVLIAQARRSVLIIGVNLEGALGCTAALTTLARSGGTVRLLAMALTGRRSRRRRRHPGSIRSAHERLPALRPR